MADFTGINYLSQKAYDLGAVTINGAKSFYSSNRKGEATLNAVKSFYSFNRKIDGKIYGKIYDFVTGKMNITQKAFGLISQSNSYLNNLINPNNQTVVRPSFVQAHNSTWFDQGFQPSNSTEAELGRKFQISLFNGTSTAADKPVEKSVGFFSSAVSHVKGAVAGMKKVPGQVQQKVIAPITIAVKEAATNPMTLGYAGSVIGGAVMIGSLLKAGINGKTQGIRKQLPALGLALGGAVVTGLSQIAATTPAHRIALGVTTLAAGVVSGVAVAIASTRKPSAV